MDNKDYFILEGVNNKIKDAWYDFYSRYYSALCSYIAMLTNSTDVAEDIVQEIFISLWESNNTFNSINQLTSYLYRACYNNALTYIRNNQIHSSILSKLAEEDSNSLVDEIYAMTVKEEVIRQLYLYIKELPEKQQQILLLRIDGLSWDEIASKLGVSVNTIKTQKKRSYKYLRDRLNRGTFSIILSMIY